MRYAREFAVPRVCLDRRMDWSIIFPMNACRSGGSAPVSFPLFQSIRLGAGSSELALSCMAALLDYRGGPACLERRMAEILSAFGRADKSGFWPGTVCPLLTQQRHPTSRLLRWHQPIYYGRALIRALMAFSLDLSYHYTVGIFAHCKGKL
jgi:hypothetical protein